MRLGAVVTVLFLAFASVGEAQPVARPPRIGYVDPRARDMELASVRGLRDGLRERGYVEGQSILVEYRFAEGRPERLPGIVDELLRLNVDLLVTVGTVVTRAAQRATTVVPIVMTAGEPVESGFVKSLARPGANITGLSLQETPELAAKRLELLRQVIPGATRVAYIWVPKDRTVLSEPLQRAAEALRVKLLSFEVRTGADFDGVFRGIIQQRADALMTDGDPLTGGAARRIADFAATHRLPTISPRPYFVEEGGLMSYGADTYQLSRQQTGYIDRILKGAKPADLPVEQASKFELVVNGRVARKLGVVIPPSIRIRVDRVVE